MSQVTPPSVNLDPFLVTFWKGTYLVRNMQAAPALVDLVPKGWMITEMSSASDDPLGRSRESIVARREDGSVIFITRECKRAMVTINAAGFPMSLEAGVELGSWLGERGLISWCAGLPELPPADAWFDSDVEFALRRRSARYFEVRTTLDHLMQVLRHWAECQGGVLLDGWSDTQDGAVLRAAYASERPLVVHEASTGLLVVPALRASVSYPDIRVSVASEWDPLAVCRLSVLDSARVELLVSTDWPALHHQLVAYLKTRFRVGPLLSPWGEIPRDDVMEQPGDTPDRRRKRSLPQAEELFDRLEQLPTDIQSQLVEHASRMNRLPEYDRARVMALAFLAYTVDVLATMAEDPWFGCYSIVLDQAYQTVQRHLYELTAGVPELEPVIRSLPANLAKWAELHEAGMADGELRRIQSLVAALAADFAWDGLPQRLVNDERTLTLGHVLGYERVLADYREQASARIRAARRRLRLPEVAPPPSDAADTSFRNERPKPETDEIDRLIEVCPDAVRDEMDRTILRRYIEGKSVPEIAEEVYLTQKTVHNRLTAIRNRLPESVRYQLYRKPPGTSVSQHPHKQLA